MRNRLAAEKIDFVYSSELKRARATAETIASFHSLEVVTCSVLNEIDFGALEGLNFSEINGWYPEVARLWSQRSPGLAYPAGESLPQLEERVAEFRERLSVHTDTETVLIVAHSGVLRTLICQLLDLPIKSRWNIRVDLASLSIVNSYAETAIMSLLNDTSHLNEQYQPPLSPNHGGN